MKNIICNKTKLPPVGDKMKLTCNVRKAINWWNNLSYPDRDYSRRLCYPTQKSVHISDKQKEEMYNLLATK